MFNPAHMARKWWAFLLLALILAGGGLSWTWQEATSRLEAELARWSEARRAEGWQVTHGKPERAGFPRGAVLNLPGLSLRAPNGLGWQSADATLGVFPQDHRQLRLELNGAQQLVLPLRVVLHSQLLVVLILDHSFIFLLEVWHLLKMPLIYYMFVQRLSFQLV
jgi:hypothetical protein